MAVSEGRSQQSCGCGHYFGRIPAPLSEKIVQVSYCCSMLDLSSGRPLAARTSPWSKPHPCEEARSAEAVVHS